MADVITTVKTPTREIFLHPGQAQILESPSRFTAMICGTGGGKTYVGPLWMLREIERNPTDEFIISAPTYKILQRATMPAFLRHVEGTTYEGKYNEVKGQYLLPSGGVIYCVSAEEPYGFEGIHARALWGDEAGQYSLLAWTVIQARVGSKLGRVLFTTTPYGLNWMHSDFYQLWKAADPDYHVIQFASNMNPHYPQEEFERARRTMATATFQARYMGLFVRPEGLIFGELMDCTVDAMPDGLTGERIGGLDGGFSHPFAAHNCILDGNDCLWVAETYRKSDDLVANHAKALDKRTSYVGDPSAAQWWAELRSLGYSIDTVGLDGDKINAVEYGIESVIERARTGRLKIVKGKCKHLLDECETYQRDTNGKPMKVNDDACDALRYVCAWLRSRAEYFKPIVPKSERIATPSRFESIRGWRGAL